MTLELSIIVADFADGLRLAGAKHPQAIGTRSKALFQPGIGPHSESRTVELVMQALEARLPDRYGAYALGVPYPASPRQRCDLCLGRSPDWESSVEVKMLRFLGDNGGLNDDILMHYPPHRGTLTDCKKLIEVWS